MKYLKQFALLLGICFIAELLHYLLPLPIPSSIYGIVLLFFLLYFHIIPVVQIKETSSFLIEIMPAMFIPAAVGLINVWDLMKDKLFAYLFVIVVSTILVMAISGLVTQGLIRRKKS